MSTAFKREDEDNKIDPKRMIILSVEGDETERTYFQHLNTHLDRTMIQIEVLRHKLLYLASDLHRLSGQMCHNLDKIAYHLEVPYYKLGSISYKPPQ